MVEVAEGQKKPENLPTVPSSAAPVGLGQAYNPVHRTAFGLFLRTLDAICYFVCISCIIAGAVFLVLNLWGLVSQKIVLQSIASFFFITIACLLVLGLNRFERLRHDGKPLP
jgi:hypothetical protein